MTTTFKIPRLFLMHDRRDSRLLANIRKRLTPYGCFIWTFPIPLSPNAALKEILTKEGDFLETDWVIGCLTRRAAKATWLLDLLNPKRTLTPSGIKLHRAAIRIGSGSHVLSGRKIALLDFTKDAERAFHALLRTVLPPTELLSQLHAHYRTATKAIEGIHRRNDEMWAQMVWLRAITHSAIRDRYVYEKLRHQEAPDKKRELGPWRQLSYIRRRTRRLFSNQVFRTIEDKQEQFWFDFDIQHALTGHLDEFIASLDNYSKDMKALCRVQQPNQ